LLTDGKRIYLETSEREVIDILKNARQPILGVCLSDAVREIHAEIRTQLPEVMVAAEQRSRRKTVVKGKARAAAAGAQPLAAKRRAI
jgi:hypothetical protein